MEERLSGIPDWIITLLIGGGVMTLMLGFVCNKDGVITDNYCNKTGVIPWD